MAATEQSEESSERQSVIVSIKLTNEAFGDKDEGQRFYDLEDRLKELLDGRDVGEFDGNLIGEGLWELYFCGPDANALWEAIQPTIRAYNPPAGSSVDKLYGGPGDADETFDL